MLGNVQNDLSFKLHNSVFFSWFPRIRSLRRGFLCKWSIQDVPSQHSGQLGDGAQLRHQENLSHTLWGWLLPHCFKWGNYGTKSLTCPVTFSKLGFDPRSVWTQVLDHFASTISAIWVVTSNLGPVQSPEIAQRRAWWTSQRGQGLQCYIEK